MPVQRARIDVVMMPGWEAAVGDRVDAALDAVAEDIEADIKATAPVDTGELVASVHRDGHRVYVATDHWQSVEYGTRPHTIEPRTKKALWWPGAAHPVARVQHPGTPAQPFMRPALYKKRTLRTPPGMRSTR